MHLLDGEILFLKLITLNVVPKDTKGFFGVSKSGVDNPHRASLGPAANIEPWNRCLAFLVEHTAKLMRYGLLFIIERSASNRSRGVTY